MSEAQPKTETMPEPKLIIDEARGRLWLQMEHKGNIAVERLPLHFLKMNTEQKRWHLAAHKYVHKLFKKLGLKPPK